MHDTPQIKEFAKKLVALKREFARTYRRSSHFQEIVPVPAGGFGADSGHLEMLHGFARNNPIYHNSFEREVSGVRCTVYEGDINTHWLNSTKHGASCQPFYPTWLLSAYLMASYAAELGCRHLVDVGSGDGRIAYCGSLLELKSHSIEIDGGLAELQSAMAESTGVLFEHRCADATAVNYPAMGLESAAFFIGGLPQMGGDMLADKIVKEALRDGSLSGSLFVLAGSHSRRALSGSIRDGGWAPLIERHGLRVLDTITLPTSWTFDQADDTPYIFAGSL